MKGHGGLLGIVFSVLGLVIILSVFSTIMTALTTLYTTAFAASATAFITVLKIVPTLLLLGTVGGAAYGFWRGYKAEVASDPKGFIRMIIALLGIVLFVTLFATILNNFATLYYSTNAATWTAFRTVTQILPTILFIGGIGSFIAVGTAGAKSFSHSRKRGRRS